MSEWIRTSENLPEIGQRVLGVTYGSDLVIPMDGETEEECRRRCRRELVIVNTFTLWEDGWIESDGFPAIISPTYWMPLPTPPEYREEEL